MHPNLYGKLEAYLSKNGHLGVPAVVKLAEVGGGIMGASCGRFGPWSLTVG